MPGDCRAVFLDVGGGLGRENQDGLEREIQVRFGENKNRLET